LIATYHDGKADKTDISTKTYVIHGATENRGDKTYVAMVKDNREWRRKW
jgi:hypothetical protein